MEYGVGPKQETARSEHIVNTIQREHGTEVSTADNILTWIRKSFVLSDIDSIYYIPVNTTLFPAGGVAV
jgi:hypothetical protein